LELRLESISKLMNRLIDESQFNLLIPGDQNSLVYIYFQNLIESIRNENNLQSIVLFTPQGEILVAAPELISIQKYSSLVGTEYFSKAKAGTHSISGIQTFEGQKFMNAVGPVRDADDFVLGLHLIEARATYFTVLTNLKNRLFLFSFLNFILILLIALGLYRTIRRTIQYQKEINDQEHLVQLGQMAATVAHEIRNPLGIIEGTNDVLKKKYMDKEEELFSYIPKEIERLQVLIDNFLRFARTPNIDTRSFKLNDLLQRISMGLSKSQLKRFSIRNFNENMVICSDESLLEQSLLNIITNALQATIDQGEVEFSFEKLKRNQYLFRITDSGTGIQKKHLSSIFNPFYTTKESGTGLGLAISKRLISQLGGRIELHSEVDKGTEVNIFLPRMKE